MSYSANDNQNFFVAAGRTTSRVMAQPGGQCSISIGGWTAEELERQRQLKEQRESATQQAEAVTDESTPEEPSTVAVTTTGKENPVEENKKLESVAEIDAKSAAPAAKPIGVSSNAFASASSTNSFNVVTDRPTSRVTMPPGGHTSLRLW